VSSSALLSFLTLLHPRCVRRSRPGCLPSQLRPLEQFQASLHLVHERATADPSPRRPAGRAPGSRDSPYVMLVFAVSTGKIQRAEKKRAEDSSQDTTMILVDSMIY
jgi:hypothetical protein